jgi:hypothetical protein
MEPTKQHIQLLAIILDLFKRDNIKLRVRKPRNNSKIDGSFSLRTLTVYLYRSSPLTVGNVTTHDLYVLLHEYRHFQQYLDVFDSDNADCGRPLLSYMAELDADVYAIRHLQEFDISTEPLESTIRRRHGFGINIAK